MPRESPSQAEDRTECQRFLGMVTELGADRSPDATDRIFDRLKSPIADQPLQPMPKKRRPEHQ
jgi:hypothetical protein